MAVIRTLLGSIALTSSLTGCIVGIQNTMQPDGSYLIRADGNCFAGTSNTAERAAGHADQLCPGGHDTKSTISGSSGCHPYTQLIVKCN